MYFSFACLGRISARFAVRLAETGALTALMDLDTKQRERCRQAAGCGAGAGAGANVAPHDEIAMMCITVYALSLPRVSRRG